MTKPNTSGSDQDPAGGGNTSNTGGKSTTETSEKSVAEIVAEAVRTALGTIPDDVAKLNRSVSSLHAKTRVDDGANSGGDKTPATPNGNKVDLDKVSKEDLYNKLQKLEARDTERDQAEQNRKMGTDLSTAIKAGKYVESEMFENLLAPHLKHDEIEGTVIQRPGEDAIPLLKAVAEMGKNPVFQPASSGGGSNAGSNANSSTQQSGGEVTEADIDNMSKEEFNAYCEDL